MRERDNLCVGFDGIRTDDVRVQLPEFAHPPFLRTLIAEEVADGIPACRHRYLTRLSCDHARKRGRHFRAERHLAVPTVGKGVALFIDDLVRGFRTIKIGRLQKAGVICFVAEQLARTRHVLEDVILDELVLRIEIAHSFIRFGRELGHGAIIHSIESPSWRRKGILMMLWFYVSRLLS